MAPSTSLPAKGSHLEFEPSDTLVFDLTTDKTAPTILTARNSADVPVAFKVQTTAPKRYLVKPNNGVLEAGASVKLLIHLQPKGRLHVLEKNGSVNDRFMIKCQVCPSSFLGLEKGSAQYDEELNRFLESLPTGSSSLFSAAFTLPSKDPTPDATPATVTEVVTEVADEVKEAVAAVKASVVEVVSEPEVKADVVPKAVIEQEAGADKVEATKPEPEPTTAKVASSVSPAAPVAEGSAKPSSRTEALLGTISDTAASVLVTSYFVTLKGFNVARSVGDRVGVNRRLVAVDEAYHVSDTVKSTATALVDKAYEINDKTKPIQEKALSWRIVSFYASVAGSLINFGKHTVETAMAKVDATASGSTTAEE